MTERFENGDLLPGAPELASRGPHGVGTRTLRAIAKNRVDVMRLETAEDPRYDRSLRIDVFYPALAVAGAPPVVYEDVLSSTEGQPKIPFSFSGRAVRDAAPDPSAGPYPLVIVTHGYPGSSVAMTWLTENLASKGYVVAAIDVTDSTHADIGPRAITLLHRPLDILFTIAHFESEARDETSFLHRLVDAEHIGLVGYSMGGYASLNVAGAGLKSEFVSWPTSVPRARLASRQSGNPEYEASIDPRIRAVCAISPWGAGVAWDAPELAGLRVPVCFFAGTNDDIAGFEPGVRSLFDWSTGSDSHLVVLRGAGHSIGLNRAPTVPLSRPDDYFHYADPVWDTAHVHNVLQHFITAFLGRHVRGDASLERYLDLPQTASPAVGTVNAENIDRPQPTWAGFAPNTTRGLEHHTRMRVPTLPQSDPRSDARATALAADRETYRYDHELYTPLAMSAAVPASDQFSPSWFRANVGVVGTLLENNAYAAKVRNPERPVADEVFKLAATARDLGPNDNPLEVLARAQVALGSLRVTGAATNLADFASLFQTIPAPPLVRGSVDDLWFARNFLAGANPMMLRALSALDEQRMTLTDPLVAAVLGAGTTVASAVRAKKLFVADYSALRGADCGIWKGRQKYLPAPIAYFGVGDDGVLRPIAIQLAEGRSACVLKPTDGPSWLVARTAVMVADSNMSAIYFHHAKTHMVVEPIIVSTRRQLAPSHPVRVLLEPHFAGTLAINHTGQLTVFAPGGLIESVGAATRPAFRSLAIEAVKNQNVRALSLRSSLAERGVADGSLLPEFSFRDDALLLWDAIEPWVRDYVGVYYATDGDVVADLELRAFLAEVESESGGRLVGVGPLASRADLVELLTIVIFTASAQHWALNGPLATWMTFAPSYPLAAWSEPKPVPDVAGWIAMLPPLDMAQQQLEAAYGMGSTRFGVLGTYEDGYFVDPRVTPLLESFGNRLRGAEETITARNRKRTVPYEFLVPSQLPASINI